MNMPNIVANSKNIMYLANLYNPIEHSGNRYLDDILTKFKGVGHIYQLCCIKDYLFNVMSLYYFPSYV